MFVLSTQHSVPYKNTSHLKTKEHIATSHFTRPAVPLLSGSSKLKLCNIIWLSKLSLHWWRYCILQRLFLALIWREILWFPFREQIHICLWIDTGTWQHFLYGHIEFVSRFAFTWHIINYSSSGCRREWWVIA